MTDEVVFTPTCKQPWHVDEEEALACLPPDGWLRDAVLYGIENTDSPAWFHVGANLTTLSVLAANTDLRVMTADHRAYTHGFQLWTLIVATSGQRKSTAIDYAVRIAEEVNGRVCLANSGSQEAYHDALSSEQFNGNALFYRDEMQGLFEASLRNSYSGGIASWLLETYRGELLTRETKSHGYNEVIRPRLSLLSSIPPDTFQHTTTQRDWRSGFLPRFSFWCARRERFHELPSSDARIEAELAKRMRNVLQDVQPGGLHVLASYEVIKPLLLWVQRNIEAQAAETHNDLGSILQRFQTKGMQYAGLIAVSRRRVPATKAILIEEDDVCCAIRILELLVRSTKALFGLVATSQESSEEAEVLELLRARKDGLQIQEICEACGLSRRRAQNILTALVRSSDVHEVTSRPTGKGRPPKLYRLIHV